MRHAYNTHHATKGPHLDRVYNMVSRRLGWSTKDRRRHLVSLVCTRDDVAYARSHPSQDLQQWRKYFYPTSTIALNRNPLMLRDVKQYHRGARFMHGDAIELMADLSQSGVKGMYYLDLMCTFKTVTKGDNLRNLKRYFASMPSGTALILNCMVYASMRNKGEVSDVPLAKQRAIVKAVTAKFPGTRCIGYDYYQSASRVKTPMMSVIFTHGT